MKQKPYTRMENARNSTKCTNASGNRNKSLGESLGLTKLFKSIPLKSHRICFSVFRKINSTRIITATHTGYWWFIRKWKTITFWKWWGKNATEVLEHLPLVFPNLLVCVCVCRIMATELRVSQGYRMRYSHPPKAGYAVHVMSLIPEFRKQKQRLMDLSEYLVYTVSFRLALSLSTTDK